MGCAVLSLILWIINCQFWSKKSCCLKEYHNPQNIRTFWWLCFIFLCGVLACCISGILVSINFAKKVGSAKCIYERIYYDSKYGELKNGTKWEGLENREKLINELRNFVNNNHILEEDFEDYEREWNVSDFSCADKNVKYPKKFNEEIKDILEDCKSKHSQIYSSDDSKLIYDDSNCNPESLYYEYIINATNICKYFSGQIEKMKSYIKYEKDDDYKKFSDDQVAKVNENLKYISNDLDNYHENFLDETNYFIKISKIFGYIVVLVYYSIVIAIVLFSCRNSFSTSS